MERVQCYDRFQDVSLFDTVVRSSVGMKVHSETLGAVQQKMDDEILWVVDRAE
jgi:hypothetical protein